MSATLSDFYGIMGLPALRIVPKDISSEDYEFEDGFFLYALAEVTLTVRPVHNDADLPSPITVAANTYLALNQRELPLKAVRANSTVSAGTIWICYPYKTSED